MPEIWKNWAGNQRALVELVRPTTEHELCAVVARAAAEGRTVKAVGAGHSFTDAALSDAVLLSLEDYGRVLHLDTEAGLLTVQAGARLHDISEYLWSRGFALENMGDIDVQSIAGATSTATHGTGAAFGNLATGIVGLRIVDGAGEVVVCDEDHDPALLRVARVGVGALGILSTVTLRVVRAFHLHATEEPRRLEEVVESFDDLVAGNDHYEFFWVPHIGAARPSLVPRLAQLVPGSGRVEYNEPSFRVFTTPRRVRFLEMEYAVPLEATTAALLAVRDWIDTTGSPTMFPIEVRAVAGDDIPLSTAQGRATGYIAVHTHPATPHERYFHAVEHIMAAHDGRPHWGKLHFRTAEDLAPAYPLWDDFQAARSRMDPAGVFENAYTRRCFGPVAGDARSPD
jgi:FAD/FMN-containing dehydrogenase